MGFYTVTIKQGGPNREALVEAWNKSKVDGKDVGQIHSKKHPGSAYVVIIDGAKLELPIVRGNETDLTSKIGNVNSGSTKAENVESILSELGLKIGKNGKFLGPSVNCSVSQINGGDMAKIVIDNFVLDRINLARQLESFDLSLSPCEPGMIEMLSK